MTMDSGDSRKKISRRDFLKKSLLAVAGSYIEANTHVVADFWSFLNRGAREMGLAAEGNLPQVYITGKKLIENYLVEIDPREKEKAKNIFIAWVKFNAASHYPVKSESLASQLAGHFLYGDGKRVDITEIVQKELVEAINQTQANEHSGVQENLSDDEKLKQLFIGMWEKNSVEGKYAKHILSTDDAAAFLRTTDDNSTFYEGSDLTRLVGKKINMFTVIGPYNDPLLRIALGRFTVSVVGEVVSADENAFKLKNVVVKLIDSYDFNMGNLNSGESEKLYTDLDSSFGIQTTVGEIIKNIGIRQIVPDQLFDVVSNVSIKIHDQEGTLLQQEKLAIPFDVGASWSYSEFQIAGAIFDTPFNDSDKGYKTDFLSEKDYWKWLKDQSVNPIYRLKK